MMIICLQTGIQVKRNLNLIKNHQLEADEKGNLADCPGSNRASSGTPDNFAGTQRVCGRPRRRLLNFSRGHLGPRTGRARSYGGHVRASKTR